MKKQKVNYTHESVKLDAGVVQSVRDEIKITRQSICGFIELAIIEKIEREKIEREKMESPTLHRQFSDGKIEHK